MLKAPNNDRCPYCDGKLEEVEMKLINGDGWLCENAPPTEPGDNVSYKIEESCTECSYQYG